MKAGRLNQRVAIEKLHEGRDKFGQPIHEWLPVIVVWAAVEPLQGREFIAAMTTQAEVTARIRMRYHPAIEAHMRAKHGDDVYSIEAVIHVRTGRRELQLMCKKLG